MDGRLTRVGLVLVAVGGAGAPMLLVSGYNPLFALGGAVALVSACAAGVILRRTSGIRRRVVIAAAIGLAWSVVASPVLAFFGPVIALAGFIATTVLLVAWAGSSGGSPWIRLGAGILGAGLGVMVVALGVVEGFIAYPLWFGDGLSLAQVYALLDPGEADFARRQGTAWATLLTGLSVVPLAIAVASGLLKRRVLSARRLVVLGLCIAGFAAYTQWFGTYSLGSDLTDLRAAPDGYVWGFAYHALTYGAFVAAAFVAATGRTASEPADAVTDRDASAVLA